MTSKHQAADGPFRSMMGEIPLLAVPRTSLQHKHPSSFLEMAIRSGVIERRIVRHPRRHSPSD